MYHVWHNVHLIHTHQFEQSHYLDEGPPLRAQDPGHTPYQQVHYPNPGQNYWINALVAAVCVFYICTESFLMIILIFVSKLKLKFTKVN